MNGLARRVAEVASIGALFAGVQAVPAAARAQGTLALARDQLLPPALIQGSAAVYPQQALRERVEGAVGLSLTIDAEGHVAEAEVVEPAGHGFDQAAREAISGRWSIRK